MRPNGKTRRLLIFTLLTAVGLASFLHIARTCNKAEKELLYKGKPPAYWKERIYERIISAPVPSDTFITRTARKLGVIPRDPEYWPGGMGRDKEAIPLLIMLLNDDDCLIREYAVDILGEHGVDARGAVPVLIRLVQSNGERNVRCSAARTLGRIGPAASESIPSLKAIAANSGENSRLRFDAQRALERIQRDSENE